MTTNNPSKLYRTSVVPLPDFSDLTLNEPSPAPAKAVQPQLTRSRYPPSRRPKMLASEPPNQSLTSPGHPAPTPTPTPTRPSIETRMITRLEQQNEGLRDLLNKQSMIIIEARQILNQLTKNLITNDRAKIKQSLIDLNKTLEPMPERLSNIQLTTLTSITKL